MYEEIDEIIGRVEARDSGLLVPVLDRLSIAMRSGTYDSNIVGYEWMLKIDPRGLEGTVLDLGSGTAETFSREMTELGINVISLNPHLVDPYNAQKAIEGIRIEDRGPMFGSLATRSTIPWAGRSVAGLAQELPFADNTFDTVLAVASSPHYIPPEDYQISMQEVARVLKEGGTAHLGPVVEMYPSEFSEEVFLNELDKSGVDFNIVDIDDLEVFGKPYKRIDITK